MAVKMVCITLTFEFNCTGVFSLCHKTLKAIVLSYCWTLRMKILSDALQASQHVITADCDYGRTPLDCNC